MDHNPASLGKLHAYDIHCEEKQRKKHAAMKLVINTEWFLTTSLLNLATGVLTVGKFIINRKRRELRQKQFKEANGMKRQYTIKTSHDCACLIEFLCVGRMLALCNLSNRVTEFSGVIFKLVRLKNSVSPCAAVICFFIAPQVPRVLKSWLLR